MDGRLSGIVGSRALLGVLIVLFTVVWTAGPALGVDREIGGAVYKDLANPITTGEGTVAVTVTGTGDTTGTFTATTASGQGLWSTTVPEGTYTVTAAKTGKKFWHILKGKPDLQASAAITVNQENLAANQSIQFLASNVGGMVYNPSQTAGLSGVTVTLTTGEEDPVIVMTSETTTGVQGWWQIGVPTGSYRVTPSMTGKNFTPQYIDVVVGTANLEANTALEFTEVGPPPTKLGFVAQPVGPYPAGTQINAIPRWLCRMRQGIR